MKKFGAAFLLMAMIAGAAAVAQAQTARPSPLPPGPGRDLINERCVSCHSVSMVTAQRKDVAGWAATVQSMAARGAEISPEEMSVLIEYLAEALPPRTGAQNNAPGARTRNAEQGG